MDNPLSMKQALPKCVLCEGENPAIVETLSFNELKAVWKMAGAQFSDKAWGNLKPECAIHLFHCQRCGFEFFDPQLSGNETFYTEWCRFDPGYYALNRPENLRNAQHARERGYRTILDIGCGDGAALDVARTAGLETYGIELTASSAEATRERGHTVFPTLVDELDTKWEGYFDLISLNQVLEHVTKPVDLIKQSLRFLSQRGSIAIAVPSRDGILKLNPWLAPNWPPHHISRWRHEDFQFLAKECGLKIIGSGGDQIMGRALTINLLSHYDYCTALGKKYRGLPPFLIKLLCFVYRKAGLKYVFRSQGPSVYCFLARK